MHSIQKFTKLQKKKKKGMSILQLKERYADKQLLNKDNKLNKILTHYNLKGGKQNMDNAQAGSE